MSRKYDEWMVRLAGSARYCAEIDACDTTLCRCGRPARLFYHLMPWCWTCLRVAWDITGGGIAVDFDDLDESDVDLSDGPLDSYLSIERVEEVGSAAVDHVGEHTELSYKISSCIYCDAERLVCLPRGPGRPKGFVCEQCSIRKERYAGKDGYCPICGVLSPPGQGGRKRIYCNRHIRRNSITRNYPPESALMLIVERDEWMCHLCVQPIEKLEDATRDHLVPKALGGSDKPDNLKAAHMICNSRRRDRPLEAQVVVSSNDNCR